MQLDTDVKEIGKVDRILLNNAISVCLSIDWFANEFSRGEKSLINGRVIVLPYVIVKEEQKNYTKDQLKVIESVKPIIDYLDNLYKGCKKVRGEIVNLPSNSELTLHRDIYWFHEHSHRIHVPLYTNDKCGQIFENRTVKLEEGIIYEINNRIMHSAFNFSDNHRIHLIIDYMPLEKIKEASLNPNLYLSL